MSASASILLLTVAILAQVALLWLARGRLARRGLDLAMSAQTLGAMVASGIALRLVFFVLDLDLELDAWALWSFVCTSGIAIGAWAAARARRMPNSELALAGAFLVELLVLAVFLEVGLESLASAPMRTLLIAPAALALCLAFGASVGYFVWAGGRTELHFGYEVAVARRFLLSKSSPSLSTVTTISVVGVTLGVWLVIVSLAVLSGFESDLQRKIIGAGAHVVMQPREGDTLEADDDLTARVETVPGVVAASLYLEAEVAVASQSNYTGAILFGIDRERSPRVLEVLDRLESGSLQVLGDGSAVGARANADATSGGFEQPAGIPGVIIGVEMAKILNVQMGDRVRVLSPTLAVMTPFGMAPRSMGFQVVGTFSSKMYEYDARYVYVTLPAARRFLELGPRVVSGVQLRTVDPDRSDRVAMLAAEATRDLGLQARDWRQRNQTLFSALKLERVVAFVVLVFIILVASFSIVNTLAMSVIEKRKEIAILKTMGATNAGIMKLFVAQGVLVGGFGAVLGAALAVGTVALLRRFGFWIPGEVYYIDSLPVELNIGDVALVLVAALLIVWNFSVFPALGGAKLEPVEGLRDG